MPITDLFRLDDTVAIVTGASSGLGIAFASALADAGAAVAIAGRRADRLEQTSEEIRRRGGDVLAVVADVADPAQCAMLVDRTVERFGKVTRYAVPKGSTARCGPCPSAHSCWPRAGSPGSAAPGSNATSAYS